ncbi:hypothetical protein [Rhizobium sp. ZW T2_16]|jgi:hypothetical protein|uniref:hypothetical protein n=1 Tax=Rhizobium sp. ZW T2_16 TaxID=3378083 RepID=UPI0038555CCE
MKTITAGLGITFVLMTAMNAQAQCKFEKPTGGCVGRIEILKSGGSKPSYSAELKVTSSAGACSKVEFYVNSTPYTSIIRSSGVENESLSGTSPIKKSDIKVRKCTSYDEGDGTSSSEEAGSHFFNGTWEGQVGMFFMKAGMTLTLNVNGSAVSGGSHAHNGTGDYQIRNGRASGNRVTFDYAQPADGKTASVIITKNSSNSINYAASASGMTVSGTLTRR